MCFCLFRYGYAAASYDKTSSRRVAHDYEEECDKDDGACVGAEGLVERELKKVEAYILVQISDPWCPSPSH